MNDLQQELIDGGVRLFELDTPCSSLIHVWVPPITRSEELFWPDGRIVTRGRQIKPGRSLCGAQALRPIFLGPEHYSDKRLRRLCQRCLNAWRKRRDDQAQAALPLAQQEGPA